jgi:hypothetical protein
LESNVLSPAITLRVDLPPLVVELGHLESGSQTPVGLHDFSHASRTEVEHEDRWTMNERKFLIVKEITIATDKDQAVSESVGNVVFVWVPGLPFLVNRVDFGTHSA